MSYNIEFWAFQTVAMLVTAFLIPGLKVSGPIPAFLTVISLALLNTYLWDAALFFEVPNNLSTQTLSLLAVNGVLFWIVVKLLPGIEISGVLPAIAAPIVFTITSLLIQRYGRTVDWNHVLQVVLEFARSLKQQFQAPSSSAGGAAKSTSLLEQLRVLQQTLA